MSVRNFITLIIAVAVSESAGVIDAFFTTPAIASGWYAALAKPALSPPAWVFAPVWVTLYALMGVAAWLVWEKLDSRFPSFAKGFGRAQRGNDRLESGDPRNDRRVKIALGIFFAQLFLNALWSIIFFGLRSPGAALIEIIFLWLAIFFTIIAFAKISPPSSSIWTSDGHGKLAAWLLVPYLAWVTFAAYLNYAIQSLN